MFTTFCPGDRANVCMWDVRGAKKGVIRLSRGAIWHGWLDGRHFFASVDEGATRRIRLYDLDGRPVRLLAEGPKKEVEQTVLWWS